MNRGGDQPRQQSTKGIIRVRLVWGISGHCTCLAAPLWLLAVACSSGHADVDSLRSEVVQSEPLRQIANAASSSNEVQDDAQSVSAKRAAARGAATKEAFGHPESLAMPPALTAEATTETTASKDAGLNGNERVDRPEDAGPHFVSNLQQL